MSSKPPIKRVFPTPPESLPESLDSSSFPSNSSTLNEVVPGAALRSLLLRVVRLTGSGQVETSTSQGIVHLVYDPSSILLLPEDVVLIKHGFASTEEEGRLVVRVEDPEEENVKVVGSLNGGERNVPEGKRNVPEGKRNVPEQSRERSIRHGSASTEEGGRVGGTMNGGEIKVKDGRAIQRDYETKTNDVVKSEKSKKKSLEMASGWKKSAFSSTNEDESFKKGSSNKSASLRALVGGGGGDTHLKSLATREHDRDEEINGMIEGLGKSPEETFELEDFEPPVGAKNISSIHRVYGLMVIRENRCLLVPSESGSLSFPCAEAEGDEPERTAAIRVFGLLTSIDAGEIYILNEIPPVMSYEDGYVATLFVAYCKRPFKSSGGFKEGEFSWNTYQQAIDGLETDPSKKCLKRVVNVLNAAIDEGVVSKCHNASFGPEVEETTIKRPATGAAASKNSTAATLFKHKPTAAAAPTSSHHRDTDALIAKTSALFYLHEKKVISPQELAQRLAADTSMHAPCTSASAFPKQPVPVTILSGFLGAGKTTLLNHLLNNKGILKLAVIVNDMAEVNVDAALIAKHTKTDKDELFEMTNGCICCTLREDLFAKVKELADGGKFDGIVIESTGIGEPLSIAEAFTFDVDGHDLEEHGHEGHEGHGHSHGEINGKTLNDYARLDTCVTVVDASSFIRDVTTKREIVKGEDEDERELSVLLTDQVEFANVIVLNKTDLVTEEELHRVHAACSQLNPNAKIIQSVHGIVPLKFVLNTNLFSFEQAQNAPGWLQLLRGEEKRSEKLEYGIGSVVWRASNLPVDPIKLKNTLNTSPFTDCILRSKGIVWLANQLGNERAVEWAGAGHAYAFTAGQRWVCKRPDATAATAVDSLSEIVLIGFFSDESITHKAMEMLDACLSNAPKEIWTVQDANLGGSVVVNDAIVKDEEAGEVGE